ncbi:hypothetical protein TDB9533_02740 [Thalassocella blandensis]|nr:hypothetical protein TDB9533_02740 [Thalassocella blandensis]
MHMWKSENLPEVVSWHEIQNTETADNVLSGKQPCIFRGLVGAWPIVCAAKDSVSALAEYLMSFDRGLKFQAMLAAPQEKGRLFYGNNLKSFNFKLMNGYLKDAMEILAAFVDKVDSPAFYIGSTSISEYLSGMEKENSLSCLSDTIEPKIWIGNAVKVATHNDDSQNIACVAAGARRFTLFPPDQESNLYIGPHDITPGGRPISLVDLSDPNFERFPRFSEALKHASVANLEAGDAIYIPTNWWHNVESLSSFNVLINYWWRGEPPVF